MYKICLCATTGGVVMEPYHSNADESHMGGDSSKDFETDKYYYFLSLSYYALCFVVESETLLFQGQLRSSGLSS